MKATSMTDPTAPDHATHGRDDKKLDESLGAIERRIVQSIGDALRQLDARMSAAEAWRAQERTQGRMRESALDRAQARWFN
jgi:hypothetical protein